MQIVRTRIRDDTPGVVQYHAGDMVSFIKKHIKINTNQMILIFTDGDLFPRDGWSFGKNYHLTRIQFLEWPRLNLEFA